MSHREEILLPVFERQPEQHAEGSGIARLPHEQPGVARVVVYHAHGGAGNLGPVGAACLAKASRSDDYLEIGLDTCVHYKPAAQGPGPGRDGVRHGCAPFCSRARQALPKEPARRPDEPKSKRGEYRAVPPIVRWFSGMLASGRHCRWVDLDHARDQDNTCVLPLAPFGRYRERRLVENMSYFPLFFTFRDHVFGNGFLASVISHGRILCATEGDEHWVYGVQPGGIAAPGDNPKLALDAYRQTFTDALIDIAAEAPSFEEFRTAVTKFLEEINVSMEEDWRRAVDAVRRHEVDLPIRRERADSSCYVQVELKEVPSFSPKDNEPAQLEPALAA
jgi:hypothetical protein